MSTSSGDHEQGLELIAFDPTPWLLIRLSLLGLTGTVLAMLARSVGDTPPVSAAIAAVALAGIAAATHTRQIVWAFLSATPLVVIGGSVLASSIGQRHAFVGSVLDRAATTAFFLASGFALLQLLTLATLGQRKLRSILSVLLGIGALAIFSQTEPARELLSLPASADAGEAGAGGSRGGIVAAALALAVAINALPWSVESQREADEDSEGPRMGISVLFLFLAIPLLTFGSLAIDRVLVNGNGQRPTSSMSYGVLHFHGDVIQRANAVLAVEIGGHAPGTEHDQMHVAGELTLGGTLTVARDTRFWPDPGARFVIIKAGRVTGRFDRVEGLEMGWGRALEVDYGPRTVALVVVNR